MAMRKGERVERLSFGKERQREHEGRPSLFDLCLGKAAFMLPEMAHELQYFPDDLSIPTVREFLNRVPPPSVTELREFCKAVSWVPQNLSLRGMPDVFNQRVLRSMILPNLVRLDLRGCMWLESLEFLSALKLLECLNLRGCWRLAAPEFCHIRELFRLQCLDVENIPAVTDDLAWTLSGSACLRALNVSGTSVSDNLVSGLTYGNRYRTWVSQGEGKRYMDSKLRTVNDRDEFGKTLMDLQADSNLVYFRLRCTQITDATIADLQALPDLLLLDVRQTNYLTGRSLSSLRGKYRLLVLPGNARLAARTNAMLAGVLGGECGCRAMGRQDQVTDGFTAVCQQAYHQLLHMRYLEWYEPVDSPSV